MPRKKQQPEPKPEAPFVRKTSVDLNESDEVRGLRCPICNCPDTRVMYVRHIWHNLTRRCRRCRNCGYRFSTLEQPEK